MKLVDKMKDERLGIAILYNFSKGYEKPVPMELYDIVLPFIYHDAFRKEILKHDTLKDVMEASIEADPHFKEVILEAINDDEGITSKALGMAMMGGMLTYEMIDGKVCGKLHEAEVLDFNECIIFGKMMQDHTKEEILDLLHQELRIVFLQVETLGKDVDTHIFDDLGRVTYHENVDQLDVISLCKDADIVITNKNLFRKVEIDRCPYLKMIAVTATGTNNVDLDYAKEKGIRVANVKGYSTEAVAQLTLALCLELIEHTSRYDSYVKSHQYEKDKVFSFFGYSFHELSTMTWGIVGLGAIGQRVARIAEALGCQVQYYSTTGHHQDEHFKQVDFDTLLKTSDIISIHSPLTKETEHLFDAEAFKKMKDTAYLINVGRGPIIDEEALSDALNNNLIAGAGLDVFEKEPLPSTSPLYSVDPHKVVFTPHVAWGSVEARHRLILEVRENIIAFIKGEDRNNC